MKHLVILVFISLINVSCSLSEESDISAKKTDSGLNCYLPYSVKRDHTVAGCEVPGYHMRYDIAKKGKIFMILLPDGADSVKNSATYFSIDTFSLEGGSLQQLFDADIKAMVNDRPGTKIIKNLTYQLPVKDSGACLGAELAYPSAEFPHEIFFMCDTGSKNYAIMLSLGARTKKALAEAHPIFLKWLEVPQMVKDVTIHVF